jgi:ArsR family transcriptional regulator, arsenate/arsenite/antimonite-responsive transcriptional repressor / arsenate reductase (thioredoxin)
MHLTGLLHLIELMYFRSVAPTAPPDVLRLTGHPVRWQLLNELSRSDRQVRELSERVGRRQSLTSYHLGQLRGGGLVSTRRSSADGRDTYYSLDLTACRERLARAGAALHPGLRLVPATTPPRSTTHARPARVLFLCTGNSSRSQMAEAITAQLGGPRIEAASAGSHPKALHPDAVRVMHERGLDISGRRSKHVGEFAGQRFDHVVSLCDRVREVCPEFAGSPEKAHWSMPDPASDDAGYAAFVRTADELETRIPFLLAAIDHLRSTREES